MGEPRYAGFWRRFFAFLIDRIIVAGALIILVLFSGVLMTLSSGVPMVPEFFAFVFMILALAVYLGYDAFFISGRDAATPGKKALGLAVIDADTKKRPITIGKALVREVLGRNIVDRLTLHLGDLLIVFDSRKQALHEKIAGTCVVYRDSLEEGTK